MRLRRKRVTYREPTRQKKIKNTDDYPEHGDKLFNSFTFLNSRIILQDCAEICKVQNCEIFFICKAVEPGLMHGTLHFACLKRQFKILNDNLAP